MAISPPSDILSEVARAADPTRYQAATQSLLQGAAPAGGPTFEEAVRAVSARPLGGGADIYQMRNALRNDAESAEALKSKRTAQEFEAFILQTFVESMLPKNAENTYGKGNAGSIWKSMMAEQIGAQVAKAGGVGIAKHILVEQK
ncbi:rod-binding protein [Microvirga sp. ACRRW]|uniref:rod-binding protein n=1 Tax=Microvirga sp. ACRRW TaxID=2918205 RepID=UPI001EF68648|nr:rod-binding protein [Microvirga sp. ACRRW]MCG7392020.1 rod-binding protein [Microvirga sp. ACRRW]